MHDAVVIGAGPNGLVAANSLADAGWDVLVLEAASEPGGAARTGALTLPGYRHDLFSAFYPLAPLSPALKPLDLESHGLRWRRTPLVLAHPTPDGACVVLSTDIEETAASLDAFAPGDGDAWKRLYAQWQRSGPALIDSIFGPFPPVRAGVRMLRSLGALDELLRFARFGLLPVRRLAEEEFRGAGGPRLLAGNALHADLTPDAAGGALFGWLLCMLGQQVGFPFPEGGAGGITQALAARLRARGGTIRCDERVVQVLRSGGRATGVRTAGGEEVRARRAVLGDVPAPILLRDLAGLDLPDLRRFQYDSATVKVDWALSEPIPWLAAAARRAGTIHVTEGVDGLTEQTSQLLRGLVPDPPFLILGQYASGDPTRAPAGHDTAWAYTHVPQKVRGDAGADGLEGRWDERETDAFVRRIEDQVEALAPGFRDRILARHVFTPATMEAENPSLVGGAINQGTAQLHQQLVFRPVTGLGRPETPLAGLYLASSSAHPGGGVHGAPGANAARAALNAGRPQNRALRRALRRFD